MANKLLRYRLAAWSYLFYFQKEWIMFSYKLLLPLKDKPWEWQTKCIPSGLSCIIPWSLAFTNLSCPGNGSSVSRSSAYFRRMTFVPGCLLLILALKLPKPSMPQFKPCTNTTVLYVTAIGNIATRRIIASTLNWTWCMVGGLRIFCFSKIIFWTVKKSVFVKTGKIIYLSYP